MPSFYEQLSVPQNNMPNGGCPGNDRNVRMDCGRRADGSEVHILEGNGGDVGRGTVKFNLRGEGGREMIAPQQPQSQACPQTVESLIRLQYANMEGEALVYIDVNVYLLPLHICIPSPDVVY